MLAWTRALGYLRTLVFAALLGIPVAFAAVLFQTVLHDTVFLLFEVAAAAGRSRRQRWGGHFCPDSSLQAPGH